jgi:hypothetical protein
VANTQTGSVPLLFITATLQMHVKQNPLLVNDTKPLRFLCLMTYLFPLSTVGNEAVSVKEIFATLFAGFQQNKQC